MTRPGSCAVASLARTSVRLYNKIEELSAQTNIRTRKYTYATVTDEGRVSRPEGESSRNDDVHTVEDAFHVQCEQTIPALFSEAIRHTHQSFNT